MVEVSGHRVVNLRAQPVELHLPTRVLVLAPRRSADISAVEAAAPQLAVLRQRRLVRVSAVPGPLAPPASPGLAEREAVDNPEGPATPPTEAGGGQPEGRAEAASPRKPEKSEESRGHGEREPRLGATPESR